MSVHYKFQDCLSSELSTITVVAGTLIFCRDSGECYYDTLEGERVPVSKNIELLDADSDRTGIVTPESNILYVVKATKKLWIYNAGWVCLTPDTPSTYFDIDNIEVANGSTATTVTDSRITTTSSGTFVPIPALADLFTTATVTCAAGSANITVAGDNPIIGTLKITV